MTFHMDIRQAQAYRIAMDDQGTKEVPGPRDNPWVVEAFRMVGASWFKDDETAWCGAAAGRWMVEAGLPVLAGGKSVTARAWHNEGWGVAVPIEQAPKGAVIVLRRGSYNGTSGHVALLHRLVRDAAGKVVGFELIGGNQSNAINVQYYDRYDSQGRDLLLSARVWPSEEKPAVSPEVNDMVNKGGILVAIIAALAALFGFGG
jgi:uncharacterized protein (TIGR02594 family)